MRLNLIVSNIIYIRGKKCVCGELNTKQCRTNIDYLMSSILKAFYTYLHTHTHIYIQVYVCVCVYTGIYIYNAHIYIMSGMATFIKTGLPLKIIKVNNISGHAKMLLLYSVKIRKV